MEARAEARYVRGSAQKARLVVDLIRGHNAGEAINILRATNKRIAPVVEKVLRAPSPTPRTARPTWTSTSWWFPRPTSTRGRA